MVTIILAFTEGRPRISAGIAGIGCAYAAWIQFRVFRAYGFFCPWCLGATVLLFVSAISLLLTRKMDNKGALIAPFAFIAAFGIAALVPAAPLPEVKIDLTNVNRQVLTGIDNANVAVTVVFGSPECPACLSEFPRVIQEARERKRQIAYRYIPIHDTRPEMHLASILLASIERGDPLSVRAILSSASTEERIARASNLLRLSREESERYIARVQHDVSIGKALNINRLPTVIDCASDGGCTIRLE